jgi:hypothetical protein
MNMRRFVGRVLVTATLVTLTTTGSKAFAGQYTAPVVEVGTKTCSAGSYMPYIKFAGFTWSLGWIGLNQGPVGIALATQIVTTSVATGKSVTGGCTGSNGGSGCSTMVCGSDGVTYWNLDNISLSQ